MLWIISKDFEKRRKGGITSRIFKIFKFFLGEIGCFIKRNYIIGFLSFESSLLADVQDKSCKYHC